MIWSIIMGWIAKRGIVIGIGAAVVAGIAFWDSKRADRHRKEGATQVVEASKKAGKRRNEKVAKIRRRIRRDGAADRLFKEYGGRD